MAQTFYKDVSIEYVSRQQTWSYLSEALRAYRDSNKEVNIPARVAWLCSTDETNPTMDAFRALMGLMSLPSARCLQRLWRFARDTPKISTKAWNAHWRTCGAARLSPTELAEMADAAKSIDDLNKVRLVPAYATIKMTPNIQPRFILCRHCFSFKGPCVTPF